MRRLLLAVLLSAAVIAIASAQSVSVLGTRGIVVSLDSGETSSSSTPTLTPLRFTPVADTTYRILGGFVMSTTDPTVAPRVGISWPGGTVGGACRFDAATGVTLPHGTNGDSGNTGWPGSAGDHGLIAFNCLFGMGGSPTGEFIVGVRSEVTGPETVTLHAHSWIEIGVTP